MFFLSYRALASCLFLSLAGAGRSESSLLVLESPGACAMQPCVHGICMENISGGYQCFCQNGYTGLNCQTNFDDCRSEPCVNGGSCIDGIDGFTCVCGQGYTGVSCETDINECSSDPCSNNGICEDLVNDYVCHCPFGYFGMNCEHYYNVCAAETELCKNGGSCILGPSNTSSCSCPENYFGEKCELSSCPCVRGGICVGETEFSCLCPFGWTGKTCETEIETCDRSFCNGGLCLLDSSVEYNITSNITCFCVPDYHGKFCEFRYNECVPEPSCENGATCIDDIDGFSCICPAGFLGSTCNESFVCTGNDCLSAQRINDFQFASDPFFVPNRATPAIEIHFSSTIYSMPVSPSDNSFGRSLPDYCEGMHCQNGGTSTVVSEFDEEPRCECMCPLLYAGPNCERETYLLIPQFHKPSFLKHALPAVEPEKGLDIDISFKTSSPEGTILFTEATNSGSFLMLYIEDGLLKFRFSCGHQTTVFMETHASVNNSFFTSVSISLSWTPDIAQVKNASCNVGLLVNGSAPMSGQQFVVFPRFDFQHIYIGGIPLNFKTSVSEIHKVTSLEGCVIFLQINGDEKELVRDAEVGVGITECYSSACYKNPCLNGATCRSYDDHWNCECPDGYAGPFCEHKTCFANPCEHGSTCLPNPDDGYLCICPYGKHGKNCEHELHISRPSFYGDIMGYSSYLQYQLLSDYHYHLEIRLMFSVLEVQHDSLILFNGQMDSFHLADDFLAVSLQSGHVMYIFNLGSGTRTLKSAHILNTSIPVHSVLIGRHRRYCWMEVDSQTKVVGLASGRLTALNTPSALYIGGHPSYNFTLLPEELRGLKGFEGCLFGAELRNSPGAIFRAIQPIVDGRNIQQCSMTECQLIRCANGGTCIDVGSTFQCKCASGWVGALCTQKETPCSAENHKCHSVSLCVPLNEGYRCDCPLGRSGKYCEKNISVSDPLFDGHSSYLSTYMMNIRHSMDVIMSFKPLSEEGLLFYAAQHLNELSRDFISLSISSGYVQLRFNLGMDPSATVILSSFQKVEKNSWQTIEFGRYRRAAYLKLENDEEVTSISPPGMESLDVSTDFYLGGVPDLSALPKEAVETVPSYFKGCIRLLSVNSHLIELNSHDAVSGRNLEDCDGTSCGYNSCKNHGECIPKEDGFFCQCQEGFRGQTCEVPAQCWQHGCLHGSSCVPHGNTGYKCLCSIGWQGDHCETGVNVSSALFSGASYLLYQDMSYRHSDLTKTSISFNYSSNESSGLLMWNGKIYSEDGDYLGIGLTNNHLHVVWNLGWLSRNEIISHTLQPDSSAWHQVRIERNNKVLKLTVDEETYSSTVTGSFYELNTDGNYYFGSFPIGLHIEEETLGYFSSPFIGCIRDIFISNKNVNIMDIKEGKNLEPCSKM
ncbi:protein eyes shut homolog [Uloborus diversus]|uniref:protein eyes shut homolog n=1 Tax=Uloborus diversus TaxID=327109 RepID=UPI002409D5EE|nr:protein eyes shut homolog [Uloborus diversus]